MPSDNEINIENENLNRQEADIDSQIEMLKLAKKDIRSRRNVLNLSNQTNQKIVHKSAPVNRIDKRKNSF